MNNKGFVITGILYSLMIMFILLTLSLLSSLSSKRNRLVYVTNSVNSDLKCTDITENMCKINDKELSNVCKITSEIGYANEIIYRGKYYFTINDGTEEYSVYVPNDSYFTIIEGSLNINIKNSSNQKLVINNIENANIESITIKRICK